MKFKCLKVEISAGVAVVYFSRPEVRNSLNSTLRKEIKLSLEITINDKDVKAIVLTGMGQGFCAGADLDEEVIDDGQPGSLAKAVQDEYNAIIDLITSSQKPVISAVNGAAAGFGASIVMASDMVVMSSSAFLYSAFSKIGLIPDGGFHFFLRNLVGQQRAYELIALGGKISAEQCDEIGLANRIVEDSQVVPTALALAKQLAGVAPLSLKHSKLLLQKASVCTHMGVADMEAELQEVNLRSRDHTEGVNAFFEKRDPVFNGF